LFELAATEKSLDQVAGDLAALGQLVRGHDGFERLIRSPLYSRDEQGAALAAVLEKAGMCELTRNFIGVVAQNRRLFVLSDIIAAFQARLAAHRGETTAEVVSATDLTDKQLKALGASLKKAIGTDVAVSATVDPDILGGLVVKVGSRMVDSSLRTKLQRLRLAMIGVG